MYWELQSFVVQAQLMCVVAQSVFKRKRLLLCKHFKIHFFFNRLCSLGSKKKSLSSLFQRRKAINFRGTTLFYPQRGIRFHRYGLKKPISCRGNGRLPVAPTAFFFQRTTPRPVRSSIRCLLTPAAGSLKVFGKSTIPLLRVLSFVLE